MTINMRITTKKVKSSCKHKRCKIQTSKIKIMMMKMVVNICSQKGGQGKLTRSQVTG